MKFSFSHAGYPGTVTVSVIATPNPTMLGSWLGAPSRARCTATITFDAPGYLQLLGWVQLVRSSDTAPDQQFAIDPFDPFDLYTSAPSPYGFYGIAPTLFDAPSRPAATPLDWIAHSFLAVSPPGTGRQVVPLLGFAWGFAVDDYGQTTVQPITPLPAAVWIAHLPYLRRIFPTWSFAERASDTTG